MFEFFLHYLFNEDVSASFGVRPHEALDEGRVSLTEGLDYLPMLADGIEHPPRQRHGRDPETLELLDEMVYEVKELLVSAGLQERIVELVVEPEKALDVVLLRAFTHLRVQAHKPLYLLISQF